MSALRIFTAGAVLFFLDGFAVFDIGLIRSGMRDTYNHERCHCHAKTDQPF